MNIEREEFLRQLQSAFDDKIFCRRECPLPIEGAIQGASLLALLKKLKAEEIDITQGDGEILLKSKQKKTGIRTYQKIVMPISAIELPEMEFADLPTKFSEAAAFLPKCAAGDESILSAVRLSPDFMEACDKAQFARWYLPMNITDDILIEPESLSLIAQSEMERISVGQSWIHFRNDELSISCHRLAGKYPDLEELTKVTGEEITFPREILESIRTAEVFTKDRLGADKILIELKAGKARVTGEGARGWHKEIKKVEYSGPDIAFRASADVLQTLISKRNSCEVSADRLKIEEDHLIFVSCLEPANV